MCSSAHEDSKRQSFERLIKLEKGKTSYQIHFINNRHVQLQLSIQAVTETQCNEWTPLHQNLKPLCNICAYY